jgi:hypothetical protein
MKLAFKTSAKTPGEPAQRATSGDTTMLKPFKSLGVPALCAALIAVSVALPAYADGLKPDLKIAFLPKQINNPYEVIADDGGMAAIKEMNGQGKVVGPSDAGASSQVQYINTLITQRQDAIVIAANDANAVVPYLKKAMAQGVKVVRLGYGARRPPDFREPGELGSNRTGTGATIVETGRRRGRIRHSLCHAECDKPEHLDQVHGGGAEETGVFEAQAGEDRLR